MNNQTSNGREAIKWSPRVPKCRLRKLYQQEAQGIYDEDLLNDVGWTLYLRCRDILAIHQAQEYRKVLCPVCAKAGQDVWIKRDRGRDALITCPVCGWEITWIAYHRSFKRRQLNPGGAVTYFETYLKRWEQAQTPKEKMLAIDYVIHTFHYSMKAQPDLPTRPACVNLIEGRLGDVVVFLDELSGMGNSPEMQATFDEWQTEFGKVGWIAPPAQRHIGKENDGRDDLRVD